MFGLSAFGKVGAVIRSAFAALWSPASLFSSGEQGAWYDPSDLTTMFQDRAGTTPVTADGQTVGLILDKSKGLALGSEVVAYPLSALALGASFTISGTSIIRNGSTGTAAIAPVGMSPLPATKTYLVTYTVSGFSGDSWGIRVGTSAAYGPFSGNGSFTARILSGGSETALTILPWGGGAGTATFNNISVRELPGNHATAPSDAARPLYKTDGTYHWLQFDGVDDGLSTGAIDLSTTNKLSIFAGLRKISDSARGIFVEMGENYAEAGSFGQEYADGGPNWRFTSPQGTLAYSIPSPVTQVTTQLVDNTAASDMLIGRANGVQVDHGFVGPNYNFGNRAVGIGIRISNNTLPLNGYIYSMIIRGALSTTEEITNTETWVNGKTGAY